MKRIMIRYTTEISPEDFHQYCRIHMIGKKEAVKTLRESAIGAAENEINSLITETYGR